MNKYICKGIENRKTYIAVPVIEGNYFEALEVAKKYFKTKTINIVYDLGKIIDGKLYIEETPEKYPIEFCKEKKLVYVFWVEK